MRDVTKRHEAEQALRESEERFRLLYQYLPLAYQSLSEHGTLVTVNDAWLALTGYRRGQAIGRRFSEFLAPGSAEVYESKFWRAIRIAGRARRRADGRQGRPLDGHRAARRPPRPRRARRRAHPLRAARRDRRAPGRAHGCATARSATARSSPRARFRSGRRTSPASGATSIGCGRSASPTSTSTSRRTPRNWPTASNRCGWWTSTARRSRSTAPKRARSCSPGLDRIIGDDGRDVFRHSIVALARGERSWQSEGTNYTLNGDPIRLALQWSVAPGRRGRLVAGAGVGHRHHRAHARRRTPCASPRRGSNGCSDRRRRSWGSAGAPTACTST